MSMTPEAYAERLERKRERLEARAEKLRREGESRLSRARSISDGIPFGQPILVGHHSEKRHRRDLDRINQNFSKGHEALQSADALERRAAAVGTAGISSDDPEAIAKLTAQIETLEATQALWKQTNALIRKDDRDGLHALGYSEARIDRLFAPDFTGEVGIARWALTNNGANIRRIKERIRSLAAREAAPVLEPIVGDGWSITEDRDENRIIVRFDEKPGPEMLRELRSAGFKWSPTRGAHIRQASGRAVYLAKRLFGLPQ